MRVPLPKLISLAILSAWLAPGVGALGVGLHLASHHHGPHGAEHRSVLAELLEVVHHGHSHDLETAPEHDHGARIDAQPPARWSGGSQVAVLTAPPFPPGDRDGSSRPVAPRRRGPLRPLFTAHCSLLL